MKKLFFIHVAVDVITEYNFSLLLECERGDSLQKQKETIIETTKSFIPNYNQTQLNDAKFTLYDIQPDTKINIGFMNKCLSHFIHIDELTGQWIIRHTNKPDLHIVNYLRYEDMMIKILLMDSKYQQVLTSDVERDSLFTLIASYYHVSKSCINATICPMKPNVAPGEDLDFINYLKAITETNQNCTNHIYVVLFHEKQEYQSIINAAKVINKSKLFDVFVQQEQGGFQLIENGVNGNLSISKVTSL